MSKKNVKNAAESQEQGATETRKRGRPNGVRMTPEQKEESRNRKFLNFLTSEDIKNVKTWRNVPAKQINAIIATATKAFASEKSSKIAALEAELAKLKTAELSIPPTLPTV